MLWHENVNCTKKHYCRVKQCHGMRMWTAPRNTTVVWHNVVTWECELHQETLQQSGTMLCHENVICTKKHYSSLAQCRGMRISIAPRNTTAVWHNAVARECCIFHIWVFSIRPVVGNGTEKQQGTENLNFQIHYVLLNNRAHGSVVVKALRYKPEGHGFDSQWCDFFNLPNPSGYTRPWGLLSL
jgi:hypothetical protein